MLLLILYGDTPRQGKLKTHVLGEMHGDVWIIIFRGIFLQIPLELWAVSAAPAEKADAAWSCAKDIHHNFHDLLSMLASTSSPQNRHVKGHFEQSDSGSTVDAAPGDSDTQLARTNTYFCSTLHFYVDLNDISLLYLWLFTAFKYCRCFSLIRLPIFVCHCIGTWFVCLFATT